jgi:hypothetical protein
MSIAQSAKKEKSIQPAWMKSTMLDLQKEMGATLAADQNKRLEVGVSQVAQFWRAEDGDKAAFMEFVQANFAADEATKNEIFKRYENILEKIGGHMGEIGRELRLVADLDLGPMLPVDQIFAGYDVSAHLQEDFFKNKLAFVVLLNFPLTTLEQRLKEGAQWSRLQWAESRLADRFSTRVPAEVNLAIAKAAAESDQYISEYNIWMHHLLNDKGERLFPSGMRLLSHWNLRDQIKADYQNTTNGMERQRMIQKVMERIVDQTIPEVVVNNPGVDWNPFTNQVTATSVKDGAPLPTTPAKITNAREPDTRYLRLLNTFLASKKADPYSPTAPTLIDRRFNVNREIPEARVKEMFVKVLSSPLVPKIGKFIETRLGRPLAVYDIWYNGFKAKSKYSEAELDSIVRAKYPSPQAFKNDIPNILEKLGFTKDRAAKIASLIEVDPARGSGHAAGAGMKGVPARLRTRVGKDGMDYKGFNIAVHELGHNVEQTISLNDIDHTILQGVPNTAFTEAIAFVFQARDLELLGLSEQDPKTEALKIVNDFWMTYEIAGVGLIDMEIWRWMYAHPTATPKQLREATITISKDIWNTYYASTLGKKDEFLLAVYSHIIHSFLYLPDYPIGHLISNQIEEQVKKAGSVGPEVERMARLGSIAPDLWMQQATGQNVGSDALIAATEKALNVLQSTK